MPSPVGDFQHLRISSEPRSGWHKANRSLVIREALARIQEELTGKSAEDVIRYFIERLARRAASPRGAAQTSAADTQDDTRTKH
jgi:hypothetical protein